MYPENNENEHVTDAEYETVERDDEDGEDGQDDGGDGEFDDGDGGLTGEIVSPEEADRALAVNSDNAAALYDAYEPEEAAELRSAVRYAKEVMAHSAVESGRALAQVKALVKHGNWNKWVSLEFGMSMRTAQNFLSIARMADTAKTLFGPDGESKVMSLPQTVGYQVGDKYVHDEDREDIVGRIVHDEFENDDEILEAVQAAKEKAKAERKSRSGSGSGEGDGEDEGEDAGPKLTPAEAKAKREEAQRKLSAFNLAVAFLAGPDEGGEDHISADDVLSRYGECVRSPKHPANGEDHAMVSRMLLSVAQAYKKGGIEADRKSVV